MNKKIILFVGVAILIVIACLVYLQNQIFSSLAVATSVAPEGQSEVGDLDGSMEFRWANNGGNCGDACNWISATGIIDEKTPEKFRKFIGETPEDYARKNHTLGRVSLNSPGGNLMAGMRLGALIRQYNGSTEIAETKKNIGGYDEQGSGICASACAYAFLGGISRSANAGELGFHQFYNDPKIRNKAPSKKNFSEEQAASGVIAAYLSEMGVDAKVLTAASFTGSDNLFFPTDEELVSFGIITDEDEEFRPWRVESVVGGLKAYTIRNTVTMAGKAAATYCINSNNNTFFEIITNRTIDPGTSDEGQELRSAIWGIDFVSGWKVSDKTARILPGNILVKVNDDSYSIIFPLNEAMKSSITSGKFSVSIDAPRSLYDGWVAMYFDLTASDIQNIGLSWANCIKS